MTTLRIANCSGFSSDRLSAAQELDNLLAVNFVLNGLPGDGVAASTRSDPQAKSLGEYLRATVVDVPEALLG